MQHIHPPEQHQLLIELKPYSPCVEKHLRSHQYPTIRRRGTEWETVWEDFSELSENLREPATISPSRSSTSHTNIFSTTHHSSSLLSASPPPTLIPIPLTTFTTPTLPPQPLPLSQVSHPSSSPSNHTLERQKNPLASLPQPTPQPPQPPPPSPFLHPSSSPKNYVPKRQKNPPKSLSQTDTHPH